MKKILLVIAAVVLLFGCGANFTSKNIIFNHTVYEKGNKAVIILSAVNNAPSKDFAVDNQFIFRDEKGKTIQMSIKNNINEKYLVDPGTYTLVEYSIYGQKNDGRTITSIDISFKNAINGSFTVKSGDVAYLGCVNLAITNVHRKNARFKITLHDIDFITGVTDLSPSLDKDSIKKDTGKDITINLLNWKDIWNGNTKQKTK